MNGGARSRAIRGQSTSLRICNRRQRPSLGRRRRKRAQQAPSSPRAIPCAKATAPICEIFRRALRDEREQTTELGPPPDPRVVAVARTRDRRVRTEPPSLRRRRLEVACACAGRGCLTTALGDDPSRGNFRTTADPMRPSGQSSWFASEARSKRLNSWPAP